MLTPCTQADHFKYVDHFTWFLQWPEKEGHYSYFPLKESTLELRRVSDLPTVTKTVSEEVRMQPQLWQAPKSIFPPNIVAPPPTGGREWGPCPCQRSSTCLISLQVTGMRNRGEASGICHPIHRSFICTHGPVSCKYRLQLFFQINSWCCIRKFLSAKC